MLTKFAKSRTAAARSLTTGHRYRVLSVLRSLRTPHHTINCAAITGRLKDFTRFEVLRILRHEPGDSRRERLIDCLIRTPWIQNSGLGTEELAFVTDQLALVGRNDRDPVECERCERYAKRIATLVDWIAYKSNALADSIIP